VRTVPRKISQTSNFSHVWGIYQFTMDQEERGLVKKVGVRGIGVKGGWG
jgi:hypothetical protein